MKTIVSLFDPTQSIFVDFDSFNDDFVDIIDTEYMIHVSDKESKWYSLIYIHSSLYYLKSGPTIKLYFNIQGCQITVK